MRPLVIALGGNALLRPGELADPAAHRRNVAAAVRSVAALARDRPVVVTHGNGPQVGLLALRSETAGPGTAPEPLDVLDAETEGQIGYLLVQELHNVLADRDVVAILTQVVVDPADPAFADPTKPVGPVMNARTAGARVAAGWTVAPDHGGMRRLVPSPRPVGIVEIPVIRRLVDAGVVVVCAGGGGIPVVRATDGRLQGVEAVVDKDRTAAVLAVALGAESLLLLTDVRAVMSGWGTGSARPLRCVTPEDLDQLELAPGTMAPKAEAACAFVRATGRVAAIGALDEAAAVLRGDAGTIVFAGDRSASWYQHREEVP
jgi:carbamate kinase